MSDTFIQYEKNKGFWCHEKYMELSFEYILQALDLIEEEISIRDVLSTDLEFHTSGASYGLLTLTWGSFVKTTDQENEIILILEEAIKIVENKGGYISIEELNSIEAKKKYRDPVFWTAPYETRKLIKIYNALIDMFSHEWDGRQELKI